MADLMSFFTNPFGKPAANPAAGNPASGNAGASANAGQQQQQQNAGAGGNAAMGGAPNNPDGTPKNGNASNDPANFKNPLDVYAGLFDNNADPAAPKAPEFKLSGDIITKAADSLDFTANLPKELAEKVQAGNLTPADTTALMNHVARQAYAKSMEHMSTLTDRFVGLRSAHEQQGLPKQLRSLLATTKAASIPSAQSNPVVKAHLELISSSLASKFPDQSPDWIAEKAQAFFMDMAKALDPNLGSSDGEQGTGKGADKMRMENFDWDGYLKDKAV